MVHKQMNSLLRTSLIGISKNTLDLTNRTGLRHCHGESWALFQSPDFIQSPLRKDPACLPKIYNVQISSLPSPKEVIYLGSCNG